MLPSRLENQEGRWSLDGEHLADRLGVVVLMRSHHMNRAGRVPGAIDVSGYPSVEELMVAADILVSDYSSIFFDFALTGKPAVAYVPDLTFYRDVERGLYGRWPLESGLPVASTTTGSPPTCTGSWAVSTPRGAAAHRQRWIPYRSWTTLRGSVDGSLVS